MEYKVIITILEISMDYITVIESLKSRDIEIKERYRKILLTILMIIILWANTSFKDNYIRYCIVFSLPIMFIVSITDINQRLVFDRDIFCGIIVEIGIILSKLFEDGRVNRYGLISTCFFQDKIGFNKDITGFILGMFFMFILGYILNRTGRGFGMGDTMFFMFSGCFLNLEGCFFVFFASFVVCSIYCIIYRIINKNFGDGLISFTPFISIGIIIFWCINL